MVHRKPYGSHYVYAKMPTKHHQQSLPTLLTDMQLIIFILGRIRYGPKLSSLGHTEFVSKRGMLETEVVQKQQFISTYIILQVFVHVRKFVTCLVI